MEKIYTGNFYRGRSNIIWKIERKLSGIIWKTALSDSKGNARLQGNEDSTGWIASWKFEKKSVGTLPQLSFVLKKGTCEAMGVKGSTEQRDIRISMGRSFREFWKEIMLRKWMGIDVS